MDDKPQDVFGFTVRSIDGEELALNSLRGQVILVVNVASKCGFTPQYQGLEALYQRYRARGFTVLGFPCNQFGEQEPGSESEIKQSCERNFGVTFPLFAKVEVNGDGVDPFFNFLKKSCPGLMGTEAIKWNFTKFLVDRAGRPIKRFAPSTTPESLSAEIEALL